MFILSWNHPSGQESQDAAPGISVKNPAEQLSQMEPRPVTLLARPAGQLRHMSPVVFPKLLVLAYLPAPQAVHFCLHPSFAVRQGCCYWPVEASSTEVLSFGLEQHEGDTRNLADVPFGKVLVKCKGSIKHCECVDGWWVRREEEGGGEDMVRLVCLLYNTI